ncbi:conserved hypothetical protein, partial [Ricinus communis]
PAVAREPQRDGGGAQHRDTARDLAPRAEGAEQRGRGCLAGRVGALAQRAEQAFEAQLAVRAGPVGQGQLACAFLDEALQDGAPGIVLERRAGRGEAGDVAQGAGRVVDHGARAVRQVDHRVVVALLPGAAVGVRAVAVLFKQRDEAAGARMQLFARGRL